MASIMLKCRMHPPKGLPGVPAAQIIITPILYLQFLYVIYIICTPSQYNNHKYKNSDVKIISACIRNFVDWVFLVCSLMSFVGNWFNFLGVCVCCCFVCVFREDKKIDKIMKERRKQYVTLTLIVIILILIIIIIIIITTTTTFICCHFVLENEL